MMLLRQQLKEEYVLLDPAISGQSGAALEEVATSVLQRLIGSGAVDPSQTDTAVTQLREHMSMRRAAVAGRAPTKIKPITHDSRERRPRANSLDDALRVEDDEEVRAARACFLQLRSTCARAFQLSSTHARLCNSARRARLLSHKQPHRP
jgi:hypothetical protein